MEKVNRSKDLVMSVAKLTDIYTTSMNKLLNDHVTKEKTDEEKAKQYNLAIEARKAALVKEEKKTINISFADIMRKMVSVEFDKEYDTILCLSRGGLIPAGVVAYKTGIKNTINMNVSSYNDDTNKQEVVNLERLSKRDIKKLQSAKGILIVDDIIDSGTTMEHVLEYLGEHITDIMTKKINIFVIANKLNDFSGAALFDAVNDERWVVFEWDK